MKELEKNLSNLHVRPVSGNSRPTSSSGSNQANFINKNINSVKKPTNNAASRSGATTASSTPSKVPLNKKLKIPNIEEKLIEFIMDEIVDHGQNVKFSDIAGQKKAKQALNELVILPALNPEVISSLI